MSASRRTTVGVIFGGRSVEHDVSIVTAQQVMKAFDESRYEVVPIYISREGKWYSGQALRDLNAFKDERVHRQKGVVSVLLSPDVRHHGLILNPIPQSVFTKPQIKRLDVLFPTVHGSHGEDGTLQGLFELADIPYVGFGTLASALSNDKLMTKQVLRQHGIPVLNEVAVTRSTWRLDSDVVLAQILDKVELPAFVKPATLGSSIGVAKADDAEQLRLSLDIAINFDRRALVEPAVVDGVEINCSVIGYENEIEVSVLEQPLAWSDFLGFEDKYLRGSKGMKSASRIIPAPLDEALTERIRHMSLEAFRAVDGRGIVRIDYLVKPTTGEVYLNEMNSMPGSLAFYLWQASGLQPAALLDRLIDLAQRAHADKRRNIYDYKTNLLSVAALRGVKGTKGKA
ncbi:MAG: D-alanine--D-alanine ligase [Anaerolineae bacterium]|nr:D-alanine--D-alanine ligase [Anaerolineae bacterium]MDW8173028.1 D-alanine--D-alanine ligase family protein [Anaerolineae bacterium]